MLKLHSCTAESLPQATLTGSTLPEGVVWIDMMDATAAEITAVEHATGLHVPTLAELSEIETSSRLRTQDGVLYLSAPIVYRQAPASDGSVPLTTSVGFVLCERLLITVRFARLTAFTTFAEQSAALIPSPPNSAAIFVGLIDAIIDRIADVLEGVGADLDQISRRVFRPDSVEAPSRRPAKEDADLREILRRIGRNGDLTSKIRDSLLGIGRIVPYTASVGKGWIRPELMPRLEVQRQDITSLNDYDAHLTNKVQLLLDATLGLINIEQNNIIKVLTVVSVVGVPPTFFASLYGMNFHNMPELNWTYGYPYGLALIALSAIGPLIWFKLRGWL